MTSRAARRTSTPAAPLHADDSKFGEITLTGRIDHSAGLLNRNMRILGSYAIVYMIDGTGWYEDVTGVSKPVRPGDMIFVFPEVGHRYGPRKGEDWTEVYVVFAGPVFDLWRSAGLLDPARTIVHVEPIEYWTQRIEAIIRGSRRPTAAQPLREICAIQAVLAEVLGGGAKGPAYPQDVQWAAKACLMLESNPTRQLDLTTAAADMGLSYDAYRRRFSRLVGIPPAHYRARCVIDWACHRMREGAMTDKQIAGQLGFCDEFHFSKRFKQIVGLSPRQYRSQTPVMG